MVEATGEQSADSLLDALDELYPIRTEEGTWDVCDAEMGVLEVGLAYARAAAKFILEWQGGEADE
jgi:hypothetical protein